jgi:hypothetical protein
MNVTQPWAVRLRCGGYVNVVSANRLAGRIRAIDDTLRGTVLDDGLGAWPNELDNRYVRRILGQERRRASVYHWAEHVRHRSVRHV